MAYDNLLEASRREREEHERDKLLLEEKLRALAIAKAEADRLLKGQISGLHAGLRASEQALSELDAEHQRLQHKSAAITNDLLDRVDALQQTVAELQAESRTLQSELTAVQAEAALKDVAMQQVADLQAAIGALQQRAKHLVSDLEQDKATAEKRVATLSSDLAVVQRQLAHESAARASIDDVAVRLEAERQQLLAALELERLINEPLRHSHYATTTTLSYLMRSPVAPTVKDRASPERRRPLRDPSGEPRTPLRQQQQQQPRTPQHVLSADPAPSRRPGSAPPAAAASGAATARGSAGAPVSGVSLTFSPLPAGSRGASHLGFLTGRNLTRLGRSWATTTVAAGPPNPLFLDNLHSPLSPPPPGPPRKPTSHSASPHSTPAPSRARSGGGAVGSSANSSYPDVVIVSGGGGGGSGAGSVTSGASRSDHRRYYASPQYLTAMLRSPQTPYVEDSTGGRTGDASTGEFLSPTFLRGPAQRAAAASPGSAATASSRPGSASAAGTPRPSPGRAGRPAMRAAVKEAWPGGDTQVARITLTPTGAPSTLVYG